MLSRLESVKITQQSARPARFHGLARSIRSITGVIIKILLSVSDEPTSQSKTRIHNTKDGDVCANAGTDREAYCTYALGPVLYPDDYPVDYHFCAYCADDN